MGFRFAFAFEGLKDGQLKDDPRFVRNFIRQKIVRNGEPSERILPHHVCTEADYAEFYPIQENQRESFEEMKRDPKLGFLCVDWHLGAGDGEDDDDPYLIYGENKDDDS